jgi:hypothetical protein
VRVLGAPRFGAIPSHDDCVDRRVQQTRVPHRRRTSAIPHPACQYKRCILALMFKRNIRLSFAWRSSEAAQLSNSHRAQPDLRFGTFYPAQLSP